MFKKTAIVALATVFALLLSACGSSGGAQSDSGSQPAEGPVVDSSAPAEQQEEEFDPMVDSIDLTLEGGNIRFNHMEKANEELTDSENALVFVFDFTNEQSKPDQVQSVFRIQFFQNGTELSDSASWSSNGGDQYELVNAFFNDAMKGGTVTFGRICVPKDSSPITIMVGPNGGKVEDNYQTMEVIIDGSDTEGDASADNTQVSASAEEIDALLQGTWEQANSSTFTFNDGFIDIAADGTVLSGTYEIDVDGSAIKGHIEATDGTLNITLPYEYDGKTLTIYNNQGAAATKI